MSLASVPGLLAACVFVWLGVVVGTRQPRTGANFGYAVFAAATVWWQGWWSLLFTITNPRLAQIVVWIGYSGIIFLPIGFFHFVAEYAFPRRYGFSILCNYLVGLGFLVSLWTTSLYLTGIKHHSWGYYPCAGPLHSIYLVYLLGLLYSGFHLLSKQIRASRSQPLRVVQLQFVFVAQFVYCLACVDFLVKYGFSFFPFGVVFVLISAVFIAFAAFHDFNLALYEVILRSVTAVGLGLPLVLLILSTHSFAVACSAVVLSMIFGPKVYPAVVPYVGRWLGKIPVFRGRYEVFKELNNHFEEISIAASVDEWAQSIVRVVRFLFQPKNVVVLLLEKEQGHLLVRASQGNDLAAAMFSSLPLENVLAKHLIRTHGVFVSDMADQLFSGSDLDEVNSDIQFFRGAVFVPLMMHGDLQSLIVLGEKTSGRVYNALDLASLESLARTGEQSLRVVLSGMTKEQTSAAWAHDLVKPFTPKGSFLLLDQLESGALGPLSDKAKEAVRVMRSDVGFIRAHLCRLIHPTRKESLEFVVGDVHTPFERWGRKFEKMAEALGIRLTVVVDSDRARVCWDEAMVENRVLANLIDNAFRHTPEGGEVEMGYRVDEKNVLFWVKDSGKGIGACDPEKLFQPGLQLEECEKGLAGMGLFSAKSVIDAHHGKIWAESGPGGRFFFELPLA